jgi:hypothetical protein
MVWHKLWQSCQWYDLWIELRTLTVAWSRSLARVWSSPYCMICPKLETLQLGDNQFFGQLELDFTKLTSLKHISTLSNNITGSQQKNRLLSPIITLCLLILVGTIPKELHPLILCWSVTYKAFMGCIYMVQFHHGLEGLRSLQVLDLSHNKLEASIPHPFITLHRFNMLNNSSEGKVESSNLDQSVNLTEVPGSSLTYTQGLFVYIMDHKVFPWQTRFFHG